MQRYPELTGRVARSLACNSAKSLYRFKVWIIVPSLIEIAQSKTNQRVSSDLLVESDRS